MVFYLIAILLFVVAFLVFCIAPRNLVDSWIASAGFLVLLYALVRFPFFLKYAPIQWLFRLLSLTVRYLAPLLVLIMGLVMLLHAYYLYQDEHNKFQFLVGILLALLLIGISGFHYYALFSDRFAQTHLQAYVRIPNFLMAYYVILFFNFVFNTLRLSLLNDEEQKDYVLVLGARFHPDGTAGPTLRSRLDETLDYVERQRYLYGRRPKIIVSGSATVAGSQQTEAQVMADYLEAAGLPEAGILLEEKARDTHENFIFARQVLQKDQANMKTVRVAYVTSSFHLYRSQMYANMEGLYTWSGLGADSSLRDWAMHGFREYIAVIFMHRKLHLAVSLLTIALGYLIYSNF